MQYIHKIITILAGVLLLPSVSFSQFQGGEADGYNVFAPGLLQLNQQEEYCTGGSEDGISHAFTGMITMNQQQSYCLGGNLDGNAYSAMTPGPLNDQGGYCSGGNTDGWSASLCSGAMFEQVSCLGGNGDGSRVVTSGNLLIGFGIWTGAVSSSWWTPGNWKHNTIPLSAANILIPSGVDFYPEVTDTLAVNVDAGSTRCKRLDVAEGGQISLAGVTIISGIVRVEGILTFASYNNNAITILSGGLLQVGNDGVVQIDLP